MDDEAAAAAWSEFLRDPLFTAPTLELPAMLRAARHFADLSQRELAARVGISKSYVGDLESGDVSAPSYPLVVRLIEATGLRLQVLDPFALPLVRRPLDDARDKGGRHWPGHLDVRPVRSDRDWWYTRFRPGEKPLPAFTAEWRRLQGRKRVRRTKAQREADARARAGVRNTPPEPEVPGGDTVAG
jgi:transcriptional regulator with XRE-family HTH domain